MARVNNRKYQICKSWTIALSEEQKKMVYQKGIKAENIRHFIENFERETTGAKISSNDWMRLRDIISRTPSLQLCGDLAAGKSFLVKLLIKNDTRWIEKLLNLGTGGMCEFLFLHILKIMISP